MSAVPYVIGDGGGGGGREDILLIWNLYDFYSTVYIIIFI